MSIKLRMFIKLPYVIPLEESKNYSFTFSFDKFQMFNVEFLYNSIDDEESYNSYLDENYCLNIKVIAIFNELDYENYPYKRISYKDQSINEYTVDLPMSETLLIFSEVNKVLNKILGYVRNKTSMFWVENIPITAINYLYDRIISYYFYSPNARLSDGTINTITYTSFVIEADEVEKIKESTFTNFVGEDENTHQYEIFLDKARISLYERKLEDFIIYLSISTESFIREYIGSIEPENDIIYKRLATGNYNYLDQYYNVLLKYLKGKSLNEIEQNSYTILNRMYSLRNGIMHNGKIDETVLRKAGIDKLDFTEGEKMLEAFQDTVMTIKML